jgi:hypothetical protein
LANNLIQPDNFARNRKKHLRVQFKRHCSISSRLSARFYKWDYALHFKKSSLCRQQKFRCKAKTFKVANFPVLCKNLPAGNTNTHIHAYIATFAKGVDGYMRSSATHTHTPPTNWVLFDEKIDGKVENLPIFGRWTTLSHTQQYGTLVLWHRYVLGVFDHTGWHVPSMVCKNKNNNNVNKQISKLSTLRRWYNNQIMFVTYKLLFRYKNRPINIPQSINVSVNITFNS